MPNSISNVFVAQFDAEVKQAYQGMRRLGGTTRERKGVVGKTHNFPFIGKGLAQERIPQSDVTPMNVQYAQNECILRDYNAPEYSDIFNQQKVNFDDRAELVKAIAGAIGRKQDQICIDEMVANANANIIPEGGTGLTVAKLRTASRLLNERGVPSSDRHMAISARALESLLSDPEATSADFNSIKALVNGELNTYVGFRIHMIDNRDEGGLPLNGTTRTNLFWHKEAVGMAVGKDFETKIDWVAQKTSWLVNGCYSAGAKVIDQEGVFILETLEA